MSVDPAFGLLLALPLICLTAGCIVTLRPARRICVIIAVVALAGVFIGFSTAAGSLQ